MAFIAGKGYKVKINAVELGPFLTNVSAPLTKDALETTTMGDGSRDYIEGLKGGTITLSGRYDAAASAIETTLWSAYQSSSPVSFSLNPSGTVTFSGTAPGYTGNMVVTSLEHGTAFDGVVTISATLQITGDVTRATAGTY